MLFHLRNQTTDTCLVCLVFRFFTLGVRCFLFFVGVFFPITCCGTRVYDQFRYHLCTYGALCKRSMIVLYVVDRFFFFCSSMPAIVVLTILFGSSNAVGFPIKYEVVKRSSPHYYIGITGYTPIVGSPHYPGVLNNGVALLCPEQTIFFPRAEPFKSTTVWL